MYDELIDLLGTKPWTDRATQLGYTITVERAYSPYENYDEGEINLKFTPNPPRPHRVYSWLIDGEVTVYFKLSIMPEGCGMVVVSSLWGFDGNDGASNVAAAFTMDLLTEYAYRSCHNGNGWGNVLLATTNSKQRRANKYFRHAGWTNHLTTRNPRSGLTMWLWSKKLVRPRKARSTIHPASG